MFLSGFLGSAGLFAIPVSLLGALSLWFAIRFARGRFESFPLAVGSMVATATLGLLGTVTGAQMALEHLSTLASEKRYLILDRDRKYTEQFRDVLTGAGTKLVRLPVRSPNLNAYAERFVLSIKSECLERMIFFTESSLRRAIGSYVAHYHCERSHQGLGNRLIEPSNGVDEANGNVCCRERLGGMLRYYYRQAA